MNSSTEEEEELPCAPRRVFLSDTSFCKRNTSKRSRWGVVQDAMEEMPQAAVDRLQCVYMFVEVCMHACIVVCLHEHNDVYMLSCINTCTSVCIYVCKY